AGADVHAANDDAIEQAARNDHHDIIRILLAAGADVHANNEAALRWAAARGHNDTVRLLVATGADSEVAWSTSVRSQQRAVANTLDACADAMTPQQERSLARRSWYFNGLRATQRASRQRQALQR
ncbi:ankyrin repeat domain-containing protein, partial [Metallibacterium scheffleri]|uniref:ankyrin repeat domain-containing protein n=1 Tax=Metallibacterium scheffleri TaxID=993689 RepID=UPI0023F5919C